VWYLERTHFIQLLYAKTMMPGRKRGCQVGRNAGQSTTSYCNFPLPSKLRGSQVDVTQSLPGGGEARGAKELDFGSIPHYFGKDLLPGPKSTCSHNAVQKEEKQNGKVGGRTKMALFGDEASQLPEIEGGLGVARARGRVRVGNWDCSTSETAPEIAVGGLARSSDKGHRGETRLNGWEPVLGGTFCWGFIHRVGGSH